MNCTILFLERMHGLQHRISFCLLIEVTWVLVRNKVVFTSSTKRILLASEIFSSSIIEALNIDPFLFSCLSLCLWWVYYWRSCERKKWLLSFLPSAAANNSRNSFAKLRTKCGVNWKSQSQRNKRPSVFILPFPSRQTTFTIFSSKSQPNQYTSTGIHVDASMRMPPSQKVAMVMVYSGDMNSSSRVDSVSSRYTRKGNAFRQALITATKRQFRLSFHHQLVYIEL